MSSTSLFIKAAEIAEVMGKSKSYGYKVVRELNKELSEKGYMIVEGQTNRQYFYERFYGLLPIGVTLFAAPAKMGKTFMCMQMANAIAKGGKFLGNQCMKKNVYYLAFEDTENNQITRLQKSSYDIAEGYDIEYCRAYQTGFDLEQKIINYLYYNSNLGVVIIDIFEKIRTNSDRTYSIEYKEVTYYHELALKYHIVIVLVMHTVKRIDYNNVFANIFFFGGVCWCTSGSWWNNRNVKKSNQ